MVLELDEPSKPTALRTGERALTTFPRLYLDADIVLSGRRPSDSSTSSVKDRHGRAAAHFYEAAGASRPSSRYYKARERLPGQS